MKILEVVNALERFAPLSLQADFDNAGMQIGLTEREVSGALLCLDVTEAIVKEALELGCNLIVSHHPLLFRPLRRIAGDDYVQRIVMEAIRHDVAIVSMHTNMDVVAGGVNYKMAEKLGMDGISFFGKEQEVGGVHGGDGVIGHLPRPLAANDFVIMVKKAFGVECVMTNELLCREINTVALCGGAGDFMLDAAVATGADAFITGEMHYHRYFGHEGEIQIVVIGHYQSEQFTSEIFQDIIRKSCPDVKCFITKQCTNPIFYF